MNEYKVKEPFMHKGKPIQPGGKPKKMTAKEAAPLVKEGVLELVKKQTGGKS